MSQTYYTLVLNNPICFQNITSHFITNISLITEITHKKVDMFICTNQGQDHASVLLMSFTHFFLYLQHKTTVSLKLSKQSNACNANDYPISMDIHNFFLNFGPLNIVHTV